MNNPIKILCNKLRTSKIKNCGKHVEIEKPIKIQYEYIEIGDNSHILRDARIQNVSGDTDIRIRIGNSTGIGYRFSVIAGANVFIGNNVAIASDVFLSAGSHGINPEYKVPYGCQAYLGSDIRICDGVWLGEKVIVMSGVQIGEKSIIGAGSVVTRNIPSYCIAVRNPARVIKKYNFNLHKWEKV